MEKKFKFPLKMEDEIEVRTLSELKDNFSLTKILDYTSNGKLITWLRDREEDDIADAIEKLDSNDTEFPRQICSLFNINNVAFCQDDLYALLDSQYHTIYLYGDKFEIPLNKDNVTYVGFNNPIVTMDTESKVNWEEKKVVLSKVQFEDVKDTKNTEENNTKNLVPRFRDMVEGITEYFFSNEEIEKIPEEYKNKLASVYDDLAEVLTDIYEYAITKNILNTTEDTSNQLKNSDDNGKTKDTSIHHTKEPKATKDTSNINFKDNSHIDDKTVKKPKNTNAVSTPKSTKETKQVPTYINSNNMDLYKNFQFITNDNGYMNYVGYVNGLKNVTWRFDYTCEGIDGNTHIICNINDLHNFVEVINSNKDVINSVLDKNETYTAGGAYYKSANNISANEVYATVNTVKNKHWVCFIHITVTNLEIYTNAEDVHKLFRM